MKINSLVISLLLLSVSCKKDGITARKTLDLRKFTIDVPGSWKPISKLGYDSYVGGIEMSKNQEVSFDYGWYSNRLNVDAATHDIRMAVIDQKKAKIVKPKKTGKGTTGVYFESVDKSGITRFQISGTDLTEQNQRHFLAATETLKFKE